MIDAHDIVDYLKEHFHITDTQIVLLLAQGILLMRECHEAMIKTGVADIPHFDHYLLQQLEKIDAYLSDVIEEELHE